MAQIVKTENKNTNELYKEKEKRFNKTKQVISREMRGLEEDIEKTLENSEDVLKSIN
jgi:hypothetical protein